MSCLTIPSYLNCFQNKEETFPQNSKLKKEIETAEKVACLTCAIPTCLCCAGTTGCCVGIPAATVGFELGLLYIALPGIGAISLGLIACTAGALTSVAGATNCWNYIELRNKASSN